MSKLTAGFDILTTDAKHLKELLDKKVLKSVDIVDRYLDQIDRYDDYFHAILSTPSREALHSIASKLDKERDSGRPLRGPFHGIPIVVKVSVVQII